MEPFLISLTLGLMLRLASPKDKPGDPAGASIRVRIDSGGHGMPPFKEMLTDQERTDLIAYLQTL